MAARPSRSRRKGCGGPVSAAHLFRPPPVGGLEPELEHSIGVESLPSIPNLFSVCGDSPQRNSERGPRPGHPGPTKAARNFRFISFELSRRVDAHGTGASVGRRSVRSGDGDGGAPSSLIPSTLRRTPYTPSASAGPDPGALPPPCPPPPHPLPLSLWPGRGF